MLIGGLGEGHQHGGCSAHGQFTQAAGTGSADGEVGVLEQGRNLIAERLLHQQRVFDATHIGVIAAGEMHHAAAAAEQGRKDHACHPIQPQSALASTDHHQQGAIALRDPHR